jgi:hypothetical protein
MAYFKHCLRVNPILNGARPIWQNRAKNKNTEEEEEADSAMLGVIFRPHFSDILKAEEWRKMWKTKFVMLCFWSFWRV